MDTHNNTTPKFTIVRPQPWEEDQSLGIIGPHQADWTPRDAVAAFLSRQEAEDFIASPEGEEIVAAAAAADLAAALLAAAATKKSDL